MASLIAELREYRPDYEKAGTGLFTELISQLDFAKNNARRALSEAEKLHTDNPTTHVHELVDDLQKIKA